MGYLLIFLFSSGVNFGSVYSNITVVMVGNVLIEEFYIWTDTQIVLYLPAYASSGYVQICMLLKYYIIMSKVLTFLLSSLPLSLFIYTGVGGVVSNSVYLTTITSTLVSLGLPSYIQAQLYGNGHVITFADLQYDFTLYGDFVFVSVEDVEVHVRVLACSVGSDEVCVSAIAIKVHTGLVVTIYSYAGGVGAYIYVNDQLVLLDEAYYYGGLYIYSYSPGTFTFTLNNNITIDISAAHYLELSVNIPTNGTYPIVDVHGGLSAVYGGGYWVWGTGEVLVSENVTLSSSFFYNYVKSWSVTTAILEVYTVEELGMFHSL